MVDKLRAALFVNPERDPDFSYSRKVVKTLLAFDIEVCADRRYRGVLGESKDDIFYYTYVEDLLRNVDIMIVLGGDGTMLEYCEKAAMHDLPVLGINLGHLGFLTTLERDEIRKLSEIADGNYSIDERMMAKVKVIDSGISHEFYALNDVTVTSATRSKTADFNINCSEKADIHFRADGVIISTPTGSTAYSLAAGGPVIDTSTELFCMTPICPHSLTSRPIVFSADTVIYVSGCSGGTESDIFITSDGRSGLQVSKDASIEIKKANIKTKIIRIGEDNFFNTLNRKMYAM